MSFCSDKFSLKYCWKQKGRLDLVHTLVVKRPLLKMNICEYAPKPRHHRQTKLLGSMWKEVQESSVTLQLSSEVLPLAGKKCESTLTPPVPLELTL